MAANESKLERLPVYGDEFATLSKAMEAGVSVDETNVVVMDRTRHSSGGKNMKVVTLFIVAMLMHAVDIADAAPPKQPIAPSELQVVAARPKLREQPGETAPAGLLAELLTANRGWLSPRLQALSYSFSMEHKGRSDRWEAAVEFTAPDRVTIRNTRQQIYRGTLDNHYDPGNSAYPPRLITLLQGVTFFGPLHELAMSPEYGSVRIIGEETTKGVVARVLQIRPLIKPSEADVKRWEKMLRDSASKPEYVYELKAVEHKADGMTTAMIELKCMDKEGPGWPDLAAAHRKNPSEIHWGGQLIAAAVCETEGGIEPTLVMRPEAESHTGPVTATIAPRGIRRATPILELCEGKPIFDEALYQRLKTLAVSEHFFPIRVGCGIWGSWYGYSGGGVDVDQVWVEKRTGVVLREEGFARGKSRFSVAYDNFERLSDGEQVPSHVVVTLFGDDSVYPWVFDMQFSVLAGKGWLLKELKESQGAQETVAAHVSGVKLIVDR